MAYEQQRGAIRKIVEQHAKATFEPVHSAPVARSIAQHDKTLKTPPPMAVRRFLDRLDGVSGDYGIQNKLSRDGFTKEYADLSEDQKNIVRDKQREMFNPAFPHPYFKAGFDFGTAYLLLIASYNETRTAGKFKLSMSDFSKELEHDLDDSAKFNGFFQEWREANQQLRMATSTRHSATQNFPIVRGGK